MTRIVVTTHGGLAREIVQTAKLILGEQERLTAICLESHEGIEDLKKKIVAAIKSGEDDAADSLVLVDMFGGTPSNVSLMLAHEYPIQVVTGVNLPMLIEALTHRTGMDLKQLAELVCQKGKKNILYANELLENKTEKG